MDGLNQLMRKKYGLPDGWVWCHAIHVQGGLIVRGGVAEPITRGPNKGRLKWPRKDTLLQFIVTTDEWRKIVAQSKGGG